MAETLLTRRPEPSAANAYLADHARLLLGSYRQLTGRELLPPGVDAASPAEALYRAPFVVLSHDIQADPMFNYANLSAQRLFEFSWGEFMRLPSRLSAEAPARDERQRLLDRVHRDGYIDDYQGVRISRSGRRFLVGTATVWTLADGLGRPAGQAATFARWRMLDEAVAKGA